MLSEELKQQIKQIHIYTSYLVNEAMAGEYASAFKGRGMEFEEVRDYRPAMISARSIGNRLRIALP